MAVTELEMTYPALDVVAAAIELVFYPPDEEASERKQAWTFYRELLPMFVNARPDIANKLRHNASHGNTLKNVVRRRFLRNVDEEDDYKERKEYIDRFFDNPVDALCGEEVLRFAAVRQQAAKEDGPGRGTDGSPGLVRRLFEEGKIYDMLECDPYMKVDESESMVDGERRLTDRIARKLKEAGYAELDVRNFVESANALYEKMEGAYDNLAEKNGYLAAGNSEEVVSAGRDILDFILKFALSGEIDGVEVSLPKTLDQSPEDDEWYSDPDASSWALAEIRGEGSNATTLNVWEFEVGESVAFGRKWPSRSQNEKSPCDLGVGIEGVDASKAYAVKFLPSEGHVSRKHAVIASSNDDFGGPVFVLHDESSSCGSMVERDGERYYLGANPRIALRIRSSMRGTEFEGEGDCTWKRVELKPGDIITLALKVDIDEDSGCVVGVGPFKDSIVLKLTTA